MVKSGGLDEITKRSDFGLRPIAGNHLISEVHLSAVSFQVSPLERHSGLTPCRPSEVSYLTKSALSAGNMSSTTAFFNASLLQ
jgi:hypothetical protein